MIETILNSNWAGTMSNLPHYGLLFVFAPVLSLLAIKILLMAKAASMEKKPAEWVFTCERDADGLPMLAKAVARSSQTRLRQAR
jgi:Na+-transporting methylmalonyl-CoA/oxaloacetate decarboxylase gamma subunit